jgi:hypothetical protein
MAIVNFPKEIQGVRVVETDEEVVEALEKGEAVCRYEWGDSMTPVLKNGEYAILTPIKDISEVQRGDAVFCKMPEGYYMTHMVWEISRCGHNGRPWFKIGSTGTSIYGWTQDVLAIAKGTDCYQKYTREYRKAFRNKFWNQ